MKRFRSMKCSVCGKEYDPEKQPYRCTTKDCVGRLDTLYDLEVIKDLISKESLSKREPSVWKYFELLPVLDRQFILTLGEGGTPFIKATRLAEKLGLKSLYHKDETRNPSGSFKDRPMVVGVAKALEHKAKVVATASSGNAAAGLASYAAKAGLTCYTFVPDFAPLGKVAQLQLLGAKVVRLAGFEGEDPTAKLLRLAIESYGWTAIPSFGPFNPYQTDGSKTISYEIIEKLGWDVPDWIFVQVGGGGLLAGVYRGFREFYELGFINRLPRIVAVQSSGCAPLVRAYKNKWKHPDIKPWEKVDTVAEGLEDPFPWDADVCLEAIEKTGGTALAVSNEEILEAQRMLAMNEGLFGEPSGVAGLAGLIKLLDNGTIDKGDSIIHLITGAGLKDPDVVIKQFDRPPVIRPTLEDLEKVFKING